MFLWVLFPAFCFGESLGFPHEHHLIQPVYFDRRVIEKAMKYVFSPFDCVQIVRDNSRASLRIIRAVYPTIPVSILFGEKGDLPECKGHFVVGKTLLSLRKIMDSLPRTYGRRFLCLSNSDRFLPEFKKEARGIFKDAEGVLALSGNSSLYLFQEPERVLKEFTDLDGEWTQNENGVKNFLGRELVVSTFNCSVFSKIGPLDGSGRPEWWGGAEMRALVEVARVAGLRPRVSVPGGPREDRWSAALEEVAQSRTDLAACGLWQTPDLLRRGLSLSSPLGASCLRLLVPRPLPLLSASPLAMSRPFRAALWALVALHAFLASLLLTLLSKIARRSGYDSYAYSVLRVTAVLLQSDVPRLERTRGPARHIIAWWSALSMMLGAAFSSGLVSQLTTPRCTKVPDTVRELVEQGYVWAAPYRPDLENAMDLDDPWNGEWAKRMVVVRNAGELEALWERSRRKVALFGTGLERGFFLDVEYPEELLARFQVTSRCVNSYYHGFVVRQGAPYVPTLRHYLQRLDDAGILAKMMDDAVRAAARETPSTERVFSLSCDPTTPGPSRPLPLPFPAFDGLFRLWAVALLVAAFVFLAELLFPPPLPFPFAH